MPTPPNPDPVQKLESFPLEVRDAFRRYLASGNPDELQIVVVAVLRDHMPKPTAGELTDDMRLVEDLGYDSLAVAEMVFFFEDLLLVRIENQDLLTVHTVGELRRFVTRKVQSKPARV